MMSPRLQVEQKKADKIQITTTSERLGGNAITGNSLANTHTQTHNEENVKVSFKVSSLAKPSGLPN